MVSEDFSPSWQRSSRHGSGDCVKRLFTSLGTRKQRERETHTHRGSRPGITFKGPRLTITFYYPEHTSPRLQPSAPRIIAPDGKQAFKNPATGGPFGVKP